MSKIKCLGNSIEQNEFYLHPITLELVRNNMPKKICPTELYYKNGKIEKSALAESIKLEDRDIQNFMALPYLSMNTDQILNMYKIDTVDSLINWIDYSKDFDTINRILNVWIRKNYNELKENNKILINIYKNLAKKYKKNVINITEENINNWFKNNNPDKFNLNLAEYIY